MFSCDAIRKNAATTTGVVAFSVSTSFFSGSMLMRGLDLKASSFDIRDPRSYEELSEAFGVLALRMLLFSNKTKKKTFQD